MGFNGSNLVKVSSPSISMPMMPISMSATSVVRFTMGSSPMMVSTSSCRVPLLTFTGPKSRLRMMSLIFGRL